MSRLRRIIWGLCCLVSLLLCAAMVMLWIRSYSGSDYISRSKFTISTPDIIETKSRQIMWTRGVIQFINERQTFYPQGTAAVIDPTTRPAYWSHGRLGRGHIGWYQEHSGKFSRSIGFRSYEFGHGASFYDSNGKIIAIPAWLAPALFAIPPLLWSIAALKRRRRRRAGFCAKCGYDIRATPQRCPECGRVTLANH